MWPEKISTQLEPSLKAQSLSRFLYHTRSAENSKNLESPLVVKNLIFQSTY